MDKEIVSTNPVLRLQKIIMVAEKVSSTTITARDWWCKVFKIEECSSEKGLLAVLSSLIELRSLFDEAINALLEIKDIEEELFVDPIREMRKIVSLNDLGASASEYSNYLYGENLVALRFAVNAVKFQTSSHEKEIPPDEIQSLLDDVRKIYDSIVKSKLSKQFKADILDALKEIERSIHEYHITGARGLRRALVHATGPLTVNKEEIEKNKDMEEVESLARMFVRIDKMITFANKAYPLLLQAGTILTTIGDRIK